MVPEIPLMACKECGHFYVLVNKIWFFVRENFCVFLKDEYEFEYLKTKQCPFCKALDPRAAGQNEDGLNFN